MSKTYDRYIKPVTANMDPWTLNYVNNGFYATYRLNPQSMFRMTTQNTKNFRILCFYGIVMQLYSQHNKPQTIRVIANSGQGTVVENLKKQIPTELPPESITKCLMVLTQLAQNSKIYSSTEFLPSIPQTTGDQVRNLFHRYIR